TPRSPETLSLPSITPVIGFSLPARSFPRFSSEIVSVQSVARSSVVAVPSASTITPAGPQSNLRVPEKRRVSSALRMPAAMVSRDMGAPLGSGGSGITSGRTSQQAERSVMRAPRRRSALHPRVPCRDQPQPESVQPDEAFGVLLVIGARVLLEGHVLFAVERMVRPTRDRGGAALVELHPHGAGDMVLGLVDQRLQRLAFGAEPEAIVDQFRIARHDRVFQVPGTG